MNIGISKPTTPSPVPNPANRPAQTPDAGQITGKPTGEVNLTGKPIEGIPLDETLDTIVSVLPEQSAEVQKPQDGFTASEALTKKNELIQIWKDSYQLQQNEQSLQNPSGFRQTGKDFMMQPMTPIMQMPNAMGSLDWSNISEEILKFLQNMGTGNVGEGMDYLISRYVSLGNHLDTVFSETDRAAQKPQLQRVFSEGRRQLVDGYVGQAKDTLKLSDGDAGRLKNSLESMMDQRLETYQKVSMQIKPTREMQQNPQYMAAQLRGEVAKQEKGFSDLRGKTFSFQDVRHAGEFTKSYQMIYKNAGMIGAERELAVDMATVDMKMQSLIDKQVLTRRMVRVLQNTAALRHESVMDAADKRILERSGVSFGTERAQAPLSRSLVKNIYDAIINVFERNGGDIFAAIREGLAIFTGKTSADEIHRLRSYKRGGTIYEIDPRGYVGTHHPIVRITHVGRIRDWVFAAAVVFLFLTLCYFLV